MAEFVYTGREMSGTAVTGTLTAADMKEAIAQLQAKKVFPLEVKPAGGSKMSMQVGGKRVSSTQLSQFYSQLSDLLGAGVPLLRSLKIIEDQSNNPALKEAISSISGQVANGRTLTEAMKRHPRTFNELSCSLIEAGEEGSFMEDVLRRLAIFTQHQAEMRSKVMGAMIYPMFLLTFGILVVIVMMITVVPQFEPIFERLKERGALPTATVVMLAMSETMEKYWFLLLFVVAGIGYGIKQFLDSEYGKRLVAQVSIFEVKLGGTRFGPGPIMKNLAIARFCRVLGTLLNNGVPLLRSMKISQDATGNIILQEAIATASERVSTGKSLAQPLAQSKHFPTEVVELISVGEDSNRLEAVLINIADTLERRTERSLELVVRMIEPIMLLMMAVVVLFIVAALLLPILQSSTAV
ncbi:type II secretion system F family protein [Lacunimicrobium album]|jgi:general secretion pathway protein F